MTTPARPSHSVILRNTLIWCAVATGALAAAGAVVGYLVAGQSGLWSALMGVLLAALFLGMTAAIILFAGRFEGPTKFQIFFGIVIVGWLVKLIVFIVVLLVLRAQPWVHGHVFFFAVLASVVASLVIDLVVMARARVPYVGDVALPESSDEQAPGQRGT
ncbi:MAG: hypothetical protein QM611_10780 [Microbacterium sp.]|uniref:hypothetical protein n=1 Tax=Microbacterium sp. TaxID=51671 RepID=UPI0039E54708